MSGLLSIPHSPYFCRHFLITEKRRLSHFVTATKNPSRFIITREEQQASQFSIAHGRLNYRGKKLSEVVFAFYCQI
jgi:hypothetical protein